MTKQMLRFRGWCAMHLDNPYREAGLIYCIKFYEIIRSHSYDQQWLQATQVPLSLWKFVVLPSLTYQPKFQNSNGSVIAFKIWSSWVEIPSKLKCYNIFSSKAGSLFLSFEWISVCVSFLNVGGSRFWRAIRIPYSLKAGKSSVLVCWCCQNKLPQTGRLQPQKLFFHSSGDWC